MRYDDDDEEEEKRMRVVVETDSCNNIGNDHDDDQILPVPVFSTAPGKLLVRCHPDDFMSDVQVLCPFQCKAIECLHG